jgi:NTE family protein
MPSPPPPGAPHAPAPVGETLADWLGAAPFELILSSGFFGFFAHTGVVAALEEAGLRPTLVGGSSAGALVAGLYGAGLPLEELKRRLFSLRRPDFWDPDLRLGIGRGGGPGLLRGGRFSGLLLDALAQVGVRTFGDCALPVRVVVFDVATRRARPVSAGALAPALAASCAVPGMFQPVYIDGRACLDGGITDRPGLGAATDGARVLYHHLPTHSPWRTLTGWGRALPARPLMQTLHEPALPRLSPFHLDRGPAAFELARTSTLRALERPAPERG